MSIKLTERAASEVKAIMAQEIEGKSMTANAVLRLLVVGGGCSGLTYRMGFDENVTPEDRVEELHGVRVVVDDKSYLYLNGTEVDYQDSAMGKGFVFSNPNSTGSCGCCHSH